LDATATSNEGMIQIVLVETDPLQSDLIYMAAQRGKMHCLLARNLDEARQIFTITQPDVLLIDLFLNGENSLELVQALKKSRRFQSLKVIVFSSYSYPEVVQTAVEAGACDFLVKPLDMDLLLSRIHQMFPQG
jgi:DNA-binding response OmpR family regulator